MASSPTTCPWTLRQTLLLKEKVAGGSASLNRMHLDSIKLTGSKCTKYNLRIFHNRLVLKTSLLQPLLCCPPSDFDMPALAWGTLDWCRGALGLTWGAQAGMGSTELILRSTGLGVLFLSLSGHMTSGKSPSLSGSLFPHL